MGTGARLRLHVIASSSKGNCSVVEDTLTDTCLVIDIGICKRDFMDGLASCGIAPERIAAVLVTHDHSDHTKGLGVSIRGLARLGVHPPIYAAPELIESCKAVSEAADTAELSPLEIGHPFAIEGLDVLPFPTEHDALASCGFRIDAGAESVGYLTDTGTVTDEIRTALAQVNILAIEANHDLQMLADGPYPYPLKQRIAASTGHLSNDQAAELVRELSWSGLASVIALHLSEKNNLPELAQTALASALESTNASAHVLVSKPHGAVSTS